MAELTRREFLGVMTAAGVSGLTGRPALAGEALHYDCIVLGAGISGVTAARELRKAGKTVVLLEGSARIGGRINSRDDFVLPYGSHRGDPKDYPVELGGEFIHVGSDYYTQIRNEVKAHGFETLKLWKFHYFKTGRTRMAYPPDWGWVRTPVQTVLRDVNILRATQALAEVDRYDRPHDVPIGRFIDEGYPRYLDKGLTVARYTLSAHVPGRLYDPQRELRPPKPLEDRAIDDISVAGFRADFMPYQLLDEKAEYRLISDSGVRQRYDALPRKIAGQFLAHGGGDPFDGSLPEHRDRFSREHPPAAILLNARVTSVRRQGSMLHITAEVGGTETFRFVAQAAVCTFSAGMLNPEHRPHGISHRKCDFGELLTAEKRKALQVVRMGATTKFAMQFKENVWGGRAAMGLLSDPKSYARTYFSVFPGHKKGPHVLNGLFMNNDHEVIRQMTDHEAATFLLDRLRQIYDPNRRKYREWTPEAILVPGADGRPNFFRQDWERDEFAQGCNSYLAYRDRSPVPVTEAREILKNPCATLPLFWAGEATAPAYDWRYQPLSVHGAYISGYKAAEDVLAYLTVRDRVPPGQVTAEFEVAYRKKYDGNVRPRRETTLELMLSASEADALHAYASAYTGGDLNAALGEVIALSRSTPPAGGFVPASISGTGHRVPYALRDLHLRLLEDYAAQSTGGDINRALRSLIRYWGAR